MCPQNPGAGAKSGPNPQQPPVAYPPPPQQPPVAHPPPLQAYNAQSQQPQAPSVVIVAPPTANSQVQTWTTGLCACFDDPSNCIITLICPCVTFGQNAEIVDKGSTSCFCAGTVCALLAYFVGVYCCYTCTYRTKLRALFNLPGDPCGDCCLHCCCPYCVFCQEYRELKNRGLDPSIGWEANRAKIQPGVPFGMSPVVPMGMMR